MAYTASDVYHSAGNTPYKAGWACGAVLASRLFLTFSVHR